MNNHILIVEDDEMIQKFVALHLQSEGYHVSTAGSGAEAFSTLAEQAINLILLDLNLPDGDGLSIAQRVRETSSVPIIILTARQGQDDRLMGLGLGADEYLTKPIDPKELSIRVRNLLGRAGGGAPTPAAAVDPPPPTGPATEPTAPPKRGGLGVGLAMVAPIVAIAGGAFWYVGTGPQPENTPPSAQGMPQQPRLSAPIKPQAAIAAPGPVKPEPTPQPKTEPKPQPKPQPPDEAMAPAPLPDEEPTKAFAEVLGYGWVLDSKCPPVPNVKWWKFKSHESIAGYVTRKYKSDWAPYTNIWFLRLVKLQEIDSRDSSAITSTGIVLKGPALKDYLNKMQQRLAVIRCLAQEAKEFAARK